MGGADGAALAAPMELEHVRCNLCGADDAEPVFRSRDALTPSPHVFAVVRCRRCGLVYVNPRPPIADIHRYYPRDYIAYQFELYESPQRTLRERLVSFVTRASARSKVRLVARLVEPRPALKVLDVGSGKAGFLHELRQRYGCDVTGLDFDPDSVAYCRDVLGIETIAGNVDALAALEGRYDLVTMWHFLEHDFDPVATLRKINACLAPGGLVAMEIPNLASLENRVFGPRSFLYDVPRHLYDFSPATITALLAKAGFRVEHIGFPALAGGWIGSLQNVLLGGRMYRALREHVYLFLSISQMILPLEWLLARMRRGSIMTVVARKAPGT